MSSSGDHLETVEELRQEIERLQNELSETTQEKVQAAEYGLAVLEEKQLLQAQVEEVESLYEATKHELETVRGKLDQLQVSQKKQSQVGVRHEESLLHETVTREEELQAYIRELELDCKAAKQAFERLKTENERLQALSNELSQQGESTQSQCAQLRKENKELKHRENRNLTDYAELEEENVSLQKQVLQLKQAQVDYEGMKHERKRLQEDVEYLTAQVEEMAHLKNIVEKNLEEALAAVQLEREQRHSLKKELDQRIENERLKLMQSSYNAQFSGLDFNDGFKLGGHDENNHEFEIDHNSDQPALKRIEADFLVSTPKIAPVTPVQGDLFSEIHLTEVRKLEETLEQTELEKSEISRNFEESQSQLEELKKELELQKEKVQSLQAHINAVSTVQDAKSLVAELDDMAIVDGDENIEGMTESEKEIHQLRKALRKQELQYSTAVQQINELQAAMTGVKAADSGDDQKDAMSKLQSKLREYEDTMQNLRSDLSAATGVLGNTQEELIRVVEELAQLYHHVCEVNGQTPSRIMLEHIKGMSSFTRRDSSKDLEESGKEGSPADASENADNKGDSQQPKKKEEESSSSSSAPSGDPMACCKLTETLQDQVKHLSRAVKRTIEAAQKNKDGDNMTSDVEELQDQIVKLKAMLSTKREQIATLRSVLKANKNTAEIALQNLKSKYENEKSIVTDTMMKLRNELKALKEDAATFSSLRAMFAQRCDEYVTQLDEMQRQLSAAEEEKKTLNSLLRMAIQQKLALTQRLEDLEFDRERRNVRSRQGGRGKPSGRRNRRERDHRDQWH
ncbi:protein bicaudal D isoform X2 [Lingula anatina]|uniref:Protein bicaudal D isoform X2 n=1 Tax=Lingula anatina TaxID=7574 RepID=A0A1S3JMS4_LINAN|nr:protein bicaudal D isoform X2 [Lingula anatina]XP_013411674.1 protein bicaudal D isoform X2 [Lingula anatina]|eukprot:XP_013411673.1 protein bicaudal D isoform X2 [Lingula anatina]